MRRFPLRDTSFQRAAESIAKIRVLALRRSTTADRHDFHPGSLCEPVPFRPTPTLAVCPHLRRAAFLLQRKDRPSGEGLLPGSGPEPLGLPNAVNSQR